MVALFLMLVLGAFGVWVWSLADVLGRPVHQWKAIEQDRILWILAILFLGIPGSIGYLAFARPKLQRAEALPPMATYPMLTAAPPGWYPDPQGMPVMRWFDGRQWGPQTAPMGSVPAGGVPYGPATQGPVPMAAPPPGAYQPSPHHYPPA